VSQRECSVSLGVSGRRASMHVHTSDITDHASLVMEVNAQCRGTDDNVCSGCDGGGGLVVAMVVMTVAMVVVAWWW
jgi:hypothetical protein